MTASVTFYRLLYSKLLFLRRSQRLVNDFWLASFIISAFDNTNAKAASLNSYLL